MDNIYRQFQRKINTLGPGFPETDEGFELNYLAEMYTEKQMEFAVKMPFGLHTAEELAADMQMYLGETKKMLESLAEGNLVIRVMDDGVEKFYLLPSMHGFIDFSLNAFTPTVSDNFGKHFIHAMGARIFDNETPTFRILPATKEAIKDGKMLLCDDPEAIIRKQDRIVRLPCICRKVGAYKKPCKHNEDLEMCLAFGTFADFYLEHGVGEVISAEEAIAHIHRTNAEGNVIEVLNTQDVEIMCSCCGCCCSVLAAAGIFGGRSIKYASNYTLRKDETKCVNCGTCATRCNVRAVKIVDGKVQFKPEKCISCGLCVTTCPGKALILEQKSEQDQYQPIGKTFMDLYDYQREQRRREGCF